MNNPRLLYIPFDLIMRTWEADDGAWSPWEQGTRVSILTDGRLKVHPADEGYILTKDEAVEGFLDYSKWLEENFWLSRRHVKSWRFVRLPDGEENIEVELHAPFRIPHGPREACSRLDQTFCRWECNLRSGDVLVASEASHFGCDDLLLHHDKERNLARLWNVHKKGFGDVRIEIHPEGGDRKGFDMHHYCERFKNGVGGGVEPLPELDGMTDNLSAMELLIRGVNRIAVRKGKVTRQFGDYRVLCESIIVGGSEAALECFLEKRAEERECPHERK